jgi:hypothetical protein
MDKMVAWSSAIVIANLLDNPAVSGIECPLPNGSRHAANRPDTDGEAPHS